MKPILYVGAILKDTVCHVDHVPSPGEGVVVSSRVERIGGCAFNMAMVSSYMDVPCRLFAPLGRGPVSDFLRGELSKTPLYGVDIHSPLADNGDCLCLVSPDGERTMITTPGIERDFQAQWFKDLNSSDFSYVVVNGYEILGPGGCSILDFIESFHTTLVFGPGPTLSDFPQSLLMRINKLQPIWHLNDQEILSYTSCDTIQEALFEVYNQTNNTVVVTVGAQGTYIIDNGDIAHIETIPVEPVDTIGAGDSHLGALLSAHVSGLDWYQAIDVAHHVARCTCLSHGAVCAKEAFPSNILDF